jgi:hypothetical protein
MAGASGPPSKANNFHGFCKMAWKARENMDKAFEMTTAPFSVHSARQVFRCKDCMFEGKPGPPAYPHKAGSDQAASSSGTGHFGSLLKNIKHKHGFEPQVYTHEPTGLKYRYAFLAKSHVPKRQDSKPMYGCVFCVDMGRSTGVYGMVDMLMEHIHQAHVEDGEEGLHLEIALKNRCVTGKADVGEDDLSWDFFIPVDQ